MVQAVFTMNFEIKEEGKFRYVEKGEGEVIFLLHGLFGALSNFADVINYFSARYKVVIPLLPLYTLELNQTSVTGMVEHIDEFVQLKDFKNLHLIGNSLGGHIAIVLHAVATRKCPQHDAHRQFWFV